jgi:hypothetical protein
LGAVGYVALKELFTVTIGQFSVPIFAILFIITVLSLPGGLVEATEKIRNWVGSYKIKKGGMQDVT